MTIPQEWLPLPTIRVGAWEESSGRSQMGKAGGWLWARLRGGYIGSEHGFLYIPCCITLSHSVLQIKGIPEGSTPEDVRKVLEDVGAPVSSVVFDDEDKRDSKLTALVRLKPPPVPWALTEEELKSHPLDAALAAHAEKVRLAAEAAAVEKARLAAEAAAEKAKVAAEAAAEKAKVDAEAAAEKPKVDAEAATVAEPAPEPADGAAAADAMSVDAAQEKPAAAATTAAAVKEPKEEVAAATPAEVKKAELPVVQIPVVQMEDGRKDGDVARMSRYYVIKLVELQLTLNSAPLSIDAPFLQSTLFLGNLTLTDDEAMRTDMAQFGQLERCFIMRGPDGRSRVSRGPRAWG